MLLLLLSLQLLDNLMQHKEKQLKQLRRIHYEFQSFQVDKHQRLVSEIDELWELTFESFQLGEYELT